jgi:hypothetical protein
LTPFEFGGDEIALEIPSRKKGNQTNNLHPLHLVTCSVEVKLLRGVGPHSHPRTESSGVVGVDPPHLCWFRRLGWRCPRGTWPRGVGVGRCPVEVLGERSSGRAPVPGPRHDPSR